MSDESYLASVDSEFSGYTIAAARILLYEVEATMSNNLFNGSLPLE